MALLITPEGRVKSVRPASLTEGFTLKELYSLLECDCIEVVPVGKHGIVVDEEGKCKPSPKFNRLATEEFKRELLPGDVLVGNVLVLESEKEVQ